MTIKILTLNPASKATQIVSNILEKQGASIYDYTVKGCSIDSLELSDYDLILLDPLVFGGLSTDIVKTLQEKGGKDLPLLAVSTVLSAGDVERMHQLNVVDYITPPISNASLQAKLKNLLSRIETNKKSMLESNEYKTKVLELNKDMRQAANQIAKISSHQDIPGLDYDVFDKPINTVGGDFVDIVQAYNKNWIIAVGDISGHGIQAAVFQLMIRKTIKQQLSTKKGVSTALAAVNEQIREAVPATLFVAVSFIEWNPKTSMLKLYRHGGPHPIFYRRGEHPREIKLKGTIMGLSPKDFFNTSITSWDTVLEDGDKLLVCTDGVTEAKNSSGCELQKSRERFGILKPLDSGALSAGFIWRRVEHQGFIADDDATILTLQKSKK